MPRKKKTTTKKGSIKTKKLKTIRKPVKKKVVKKKTAPVKKKTVKKKNVAKKKVVKQKVKKVVKKNKAKKAKPAKKNNLAKRKTRKKPLGKRVAIKAEVIEETVPTIDSVLASQAIQWQKYDDPFSDFDFDDHIADSQPQVNDIEPEDIEYIEPVDGYFLTEKQKHIIMYGAIGSIMVVLVGFWFIGIRSSLSRSLSDTDLVEENSLTQTERVKKAMDDFTAEINSVGESIANTETDLINSVDQAREKIIEDQIKDDVVNKMKEQLENLNQAEDMPSQ